MSAKGQQKIPWTEFELIIFRKMVVRGFNATEISRCIGRSPSSIYTKSHHLGLNINRRTKRYPMPDGDPNTWNQAQRICAFANVPFPLAQLVTEVSERHNLSVKAVRSDSRLPNLVACRFEISSIARSLGYSLSVIGRALNRDHTTVLHAIRAVEKHNSSTDYRPVQSSACAQNSKIAA